MRAGWAIAAGSILALAAPALAQNQPTVWRDPDTGCAYVLTPQGGVSLRHRRDGLPDCPDANASSRLVDETARGFSEGLDALQREVERLRERFRRPEPQGEPL
jgi:hypothetical protein